MCLPEARTQSSPEAQKMGLCGICQTCLMLMVYLTDYIMALTDIPLYFLLSGLKYLQKPVRQGPCIGLWELWSYCPPAFLHCYSSQTRGFYPFLFFCWVFC